MIIIGHSCPNCGNCAYYSRRSGEIRLYNEKNLIHSFSVDEPIMGCKFGTLGREDGALIISLKSGGIMVKILNRSARQN